MQFAEADLDTTELAIEGSNNRYKGDELLAVKFTWRAKQDQTESSKQGRPIFRDVEYITIMAPGNKDSIVVRPATEMDKARFAKHYRMFKDREDQSKIEGTPLAEWPGLTRSMVEELKYYNIQTVEQLAGVSDSNAQGIMGIAALKQKAADYLLASKDEATSIALAASDARMLALETRLEELSNENTRLVEAAVSGDQTTPLAAVAPTEDMATLVANAVASAMAQQQPAPNVTNVDVTADVDGAIDTGPGDLETPPDEDPAPPVAAVKPAKVTSANRRRRTAKKE